jgi:hypothetical protein
VNTQSGELTEAAPKANGGGSGFTRVEGDIGFYRRAQGGGECFLAHQGHAVVVGLRYGRGTARCGRRRATAVANGDARVAGCGRCVGATWLGRGSADVAHRD